MLDSGRWLILSKRRKSGLAPPFTLDVLWLFGTDPYGAPDGSYGSQVITNYGQLGSTYNLVLGNSTSPETSDPAWVTVGGVLCTEYTGSHWCCVTSAVSFSQPVTIWSLIYPFTGGESFQTLVQTQGAVAATHYFRTSDYRQYAHFGISGGLSSTANFIVPNTWQVRGLVGRDPDVAVHIKGDQTEVGASSAGSQGLNRMRIGRSEAGIWGFSGRIAAVAFRFAAITDAGQLAAMNTYLRQVKGVA